MLQTVSKRALVPYTAGEMFDLVADVRQYPQFVPWCRTARILERDDDAIEASLEIGRGPLHKTFTTRNLLTPASRIDIELVDGPFKQLKGCWRFEAVDGSACRVLLDLDFELSNAVLRRTLGPVFTEMASTMVDAFCRRARQLYGKR